MSLSYLDAVDACYGALDENGSLQTLTSLLGAWLGAEAGDIVSEDPRSGAVHTFGSFGFDPVYRDNYDSEYVGENPWVTALEQGPPDRLRTDIEDRCGYRSSRYFQDWVRPQGFERSIGARLSALPGQTVWVGFVRGAGDRRFIGPPVDVFGRLVPHINRVIAQAGLQSSAPRPVARSPVEFSAEAAMLIGPDRRIIDLNPTAAAQIDGMRLHRTRDGRIALENRRDDRQFRAALAATVSVMDPDAAPLPTRGTVCLAHGRDGGVTALKLLPHCLTDPYLGTVRRVALVLLCDWRPEAVAPDLRPLALEFGLTPTECDLVTHLASGAPLDSFAQARGMAMSTARWHLKNAEAKTGTNRAEQLVALAHRFGFRCYGRPDDS